MERDSFVFYRSFYTALKRMDDATLAESIKALCDYALDGQETELDGNAGIFFDLVKPQIDANNKRMIDGKKGGRPKKEKPMVINEKTIGYKKPKNEKPNVNVNVNVNANANDNDNENVKANENEKKESGDKPHRFTPPTLDEVKDYCWERNNGIDAQAFIDFYTSKGWMVGKNKMKDWKACVRTWEQRDRKSKPQGHVVNAADAFFADIKGAMNGL